MKANLIYICIALLMLMPTTLLSQEKAERVRIYGNIHDAVTDDALPYTSVRIRNTTQGCSSDNNGNFSFYASLNDTLIISSIGYKELCIPLSPKTKMPLRISMQAIDYALSEVTIKPKKERYSRKDNPAVTLVKKITEQRDNNSITLPSTTSTAQATKLERSLNFLKSTLTHH